MLRDFLYNVILEAGLTRSMGTRSCGLVSRAVIITLKHFFNEKKKNAGNFQTLTFVFLLRDKQGG